MSDDNQRGHEAAPVMPPPERILSLPLEQAVLVVLAMVGGATWERVDVAEQETHAWTLWGSGDTPREWIGTIHDDTGPFMPRLPNPFTDSAAAWELETRELNGWETAVPGSDGAARCWWWVPGLRRERGPWHPDRKRAAILAVLHKYASDPRYSALIPPLLKKMEAER